jgi:hypothetical protein
MKGRENEGKFSIESGGTEHLGLKTYILGF